MKDYMLTVLALDRVGIVRDVSSALAQSGGNITHLSQTVLRGYFTLIISVQMPDERTQSEIRQAVERSGSVGELEVNVRPYVESPVHKDDLAERYVLTLMGDDRPGIIAETAGFLAQHSMNIVDLYSYVVDGKLLMLAQASVPLSVDVERVQTELEQLGERMGLVLHMRHENIFRVTSEVVPVAELSRCEIQGTEGLR